MHIRFNPRFCYLLGSRHDLPVYRVDAGASDLVSVYNYNFNDDVEKTRAGPMLEFACGARRRFALIDPLRRCFTLLDSVLLDLYPACAEELYSDVVII
jgi:hypothetical protein